MCVRGGREGHTRARAGVRRGRASEWVMCGGRRHGGRDGGKEGKRESERASTGRRGRGSWEEEEQRERQTDR